MKIASARCAVGLFCFDAFEVLRYVCVYSLRFGKKGVLPFLSAGRRLCQGRLDHGAYRHG